MRITDDFSLLNWILHFTMQVLNKNGNWSKMEKANGAIWRKIDWFHLIEEECINSFEKQIIQGIFVGHHDRTRAMSCITTSGSVRGKSQTKQTFSDAWESTNWKVLCSVSHMVITETRLTIAKNCGRETSS